jgi:hypothetical protein
MKSAYMDKPTRAGREGGIGIVSLIVEFRRNKRARE